jgi:NADH-quinone oxidoreductase subunit H
MSLETLAPWLAVLAKCVFSVAFVMQIVPLLIWAERKGAAYIQDRPGPNRADILGIRAGGLVHTLNDVVKLIMKEDIVPGHVEKRYWAAAPVISMTIALITFSVVPFGDKLSLPVGDKTFDVLMQVSSMDGGLLFVLAMTGIGVYGVMLAGWASNNKFSLLGGLRASAQMVSYELAMGLSAVVVFLMTGSVSLTKIAEAQSGAIWHWNVFSVPGFIAFLLFWTAAFAETNRTPFDLPEGEAELVGGYHTEYSSLRFALFFMAEYANMIVASAVTATLFFGGYNVPFLDGATIRSHADLILTVIGFGAVPAFLFFAFVAWKRRNRPFYRELAADDIRHREPKFFAAVWTGAAVAHAGLGVLGLAGLVGASPLGQDGVAFVLQLTALAVKVLIGCWIFIWVRWTVPRFRYDQLMDLGWKMMLPAALGNVFLAAIWVILETTFFA